MLSVLSLILNLSLVVADCGCLAPGCSTVSLTWGEGFYFSASCAGGEVVVVNAINLQTTDGSTFRTFARDVAQYSDDASGSVTATYYLAGSVTTSTNCFSLAASTQVLGTSSTLYVNVLCDSPSGCQLQYQVVGSQCYTSSTAPSASISQLLGPAVTYMWAQISAGTCGSTCSRVMSSSRYQCQSNYGDFLPASDCANIGSMPASTQCQLSFTALKWGEGASFLAGSCSSGQTLAVGTINLQTTDGSTFRVFTRTVAQYSDDAAGSSTGTFFPSASVSTSTSCFSLPSDVRVVVVNTPVYVNVLCDSPSGCHLEYYTGAVTCYATPGAVATLSSTAIQLMAPAVTYRWVTTASGTCSATCGGGQQTIASKCEDGMGDILPDSVCTNVGLKPTLAACNVQACPPTAPTASGTYVACECCVGNNCTPALVGYTPVQQCSTELAYNCQSAFPSQCPSSGSSLSASCFAVTENSSTGLDSGTGSTGASKSSSRVARETGLWQVAAAATVGLFSMFLVGGM